MTTTACPGRCGECAACETYAVSTAVNALGLLRGDAVGRGIARVFGALSAPVDAKMAKGLLIRVTGAAMEQGK
jgi:hypothetical protein